MHAQNKYPHAEFQHTEVADGREAALRQLMPSYDLQYAKDAGLIDMFYYNAETGEDGLLHTLSGAMETQSDGLTMPQGYHHEESGEALAAKVRLEDGTVVPDTRVDRTHIADLNAKKRRQFAEHPMEPYTAQVVIGGFRKMSIHRNADGTKKVTPAKNSMFPRQYDALGVLQAIRLANENQDPASVRETFDEASGMGTIIVEGNAPLIDGETPMRIRIVKDQETGKILTALPIMPHNPGLMKLTEEEVVRHMLTSTKVR